MCSGPLLSIFAGFALVGFTPPPSPTKYSDGVELSVTNVGPGESSSLPVWRADGSASERPNPKSSSYGAGRGSGRMRCVAVGYRLTGDALGRDGKPQAHAFFVRLGNMMYTGGGTGSRPGSCEGNGIFFVPSAWQTADFELGRGLGDYRPVAQNHGGAGDLQVTVTPGEETTETRTVNGHTRQSRHPQSVIKFHLPAAVADKDWRLCAYDAEGNVTQVTCEPFIARYSPDPLTPTAYCSAAPETIARLVLEARDYERCTVKNVCLYPNPATIKP